MTKQGFNENQQIDILITKWFDDCLKYNIPLSPSDVRDIVEDLFKLKKENRMGE